MTIATGLRRRNVPGRGLREKNWPTRRAVLTSGLGSVLLCSVFAQAASLSAPTTYYGMCDASAAVVLGTNLFVVANDEDNILRAYRRRPGALPISSFDVSPFLRLTGKATETDLEGAARVGDRIYWITSHGRNARGKVSPNRQRFFATRVGATADSVTFQPVGKPYRGLLGDLLKDPRLARFRLARAARRAPKTKGGLNIEGLSATPEGHLLLGFRNPIPYGLALLVPLMNPADLIEGRPARLGNPILLDLGGLGIRSMGWDNGRFLIIAGHYGTDGVSLLYEWAGLGATPKRIEGINFAGSNPEGIAFETGGTRSEFFVLSDDGTLKIQGVNCKKLTDPAQRRFRGYQLDL